MAKQSLLVADADPRSLRILEVALRKAGFAVTTASDGGEVLRKLQRTQLDALLCEVSLPGEDGLSVCRSVRADARLGALPVLLMSADREPATRGSALQAGADDFLPKPLLIKEVVARVRTLLAQREQDRNSQRGAPAAITGTVGDLGLVDLFTSLDNWQRSATVLCEADGRSARVWVRDGQVVDAEVPPLSGEAAFYRLLNWDAGSFRVDFGPVDREARTDAGTQGLLMEGMRRIDEMARLADTLPLSTVLAVDFPRLLAQLAEMPDELNGVLRLFDGVRTVREVIAGSPIDDLSTMAAVQKLMSDGVLVRGTPAVARQKQSLQQWLGSTPPPPGSARPVADEDLPPAEVLMTPPEGHAAAGEQSARPATPLEGSGGTASDTDAPRARVTPTRPRALGAATRDQAHPRNAARGAAIKPAAATANLDSVTSPASVSGASEGDETATGAIPGASAESAPTSTPAPRAPPPRVSGPNTPTPRAPASSTSAPHASAPDASAPHTSAPDASAPHTSAPPAPPALGSRGRSFSTDSHATQPVRHRHAAVSVPPATVGIGGTGLGAGSPGSPGSPALPGSAGAEAEAGVRSRAGAGPGTGLGAEAESMGPGAGLAVRIGVGSGRIVLLRYPPQRGTRRERLRRETEEARQAIAGGRAVRLTHVVELPPTPGGDDAMPEGSRRMSPAVGEVAKRFAPDLPLGRLVRPWTGPRTSPQAGTESTVGPAGDAGQKGSSQSTTARDGSQPKAASQQIGAVLADALAAARLDGANEAPGSEPLDAVTAPPPPRTPIAAPRPRTHILVAIVVGATVAAALAVAVFVRRQNEARNAVSRAAVQVDPNASASVVPGSSAAPAPTPGPAQNPSPVEPSPAPPRPAASSSSGEYARAFATGETLLKQGRYRGAIAEYRKAVALRPDSVAALIALGDAFLEADQPRNSLKPLLTAAQLDPGSARAQLLLGTAFQSLGRPRDAVAAYKRYLELEPNGEFAGDVRAIVANLSR